DLVTGVQTCALPIYAVGGNDVARERIARPDAVDVAAGGWIVDRDQVSLRVDQAAEVAVLHRIGRRGAELRRRRAFTVLLAVEHRSEEHTSELQSPDQ